MSLIMHESHLFFRESSTAQVLGLQFIKRTNVKTERCYDINLHEYGKKWIIIFLFMRWRELSQQIWILVYSILARESWRGPRVSLTLLLTQRKLRMFLRGLPIFLWWVNGKDGPDLCTPKIEMLSTYKRGKFSLIPVFLFFPFPFFLSFRGWRYIETIY